MCSFRCFTWIAAVLLLCSAATRGDSLNDNGIVYAPAEVTSVDTTTGKVNFLYRGRNYTSEAKRIRWIAMDRYPYLQAAGELMDRGEYAEAARHLARVRPRAEDQWLVGWLWMQRLKANEAAGQYLEAVEAWIGWVKEGWSRPTLLPPSQLPPGDSEQVAQAIARLKAAAREVSGEKASILLDLSGKLEKHREKSTANSTAPTAPPEIESPEPVRPQGVDVWEHLAGYHARGELSVVPAGRIEDYAPVASPEEEAMFQTLYGKRFEKVMAENDAAAIQKMADELVRGAALVREQAGLARRMLLAARELSCRAMPACQEVLDTARKAFVSLCESENPRHWEAVVEWDCQTFRAASGAPLDAADARVVALQDDAVQFARRCLALGLCVESGETIKLVDALLLQANLKASSTFRDVKLLSECALEAQTRLRQLRAKADRDRDSRRELAVILLCYFGEETEAVGLLGNDTEEPWSVLAEAGRQYEVSRATFLLAEGLYRLAQVSGSARPKWLPAADRLGQRARAYYLGVIAEGSGEQRDLVVAKLRSNELKPADESVPPAPAYFAQPPNRPVRKVVFLVDHSSSMGPVFDRVKVELSRRILALNDEQSFHVIFFGNKTLMEMSSDGKARMHPAVPTTRRNAADWVAAQSVVEGDLESDIRVPADRGLRVDGGPADTMWILCDGKLTPDSIQCVKEINEKGATRIHTVAFRNGPGVNALRRIARENGGTFTLLNP